jgi:hypothetical protein
MTRHIVSLSIVLMAAGCVSSASAVEPTAKQLAFFETKIRPVLVKHCYQCHSAQSEKVKGELLLDTREGIRKGGEDGHAVVPGELGESLILSALKWDDYEMPPKQKLPAAAYSLRVHAASASLAVERRNRRAGSYSAGKSVPRTTR